MFNSIIWIGYIFMNYYNMSFNLCNFEPCTYVCKYLQSVKNYGYK